MYEDSVPFVRTEAEVASILAEFETEHRLFEMTVRGISVWRLMRFPVGFAMQNLPFESASLPRGELLAAFLRSLWDLARLPGGARYAVKSYASALRIRDNGHYEDIYSSRILGRIHGGVRLYSLNASGYAGRLASPSVPAVDCTAVLVFGSLLGRVFPIREGNASFIRLSNLIGGRFGLAEFPAVRIRRMFSSFWWQSRIYTWILRRLGVKTLFAAGNGERALLRACQRLGIRFIELQHGIFTADHPDALPAVAREGIEMEALLIPDAVALYGDYWYSRLAETALGKSGRLLSAGASMIERFRTERAMNFHSSNKHPRLVVTTQGVDRDALIGFLLRFLSLYQGGCLMTVKLHPAFDSSLDVYIQLLGFDARVRIVKGSEDPNTYELIAGADIHLSIASACHFDALGIGTPTLVIGLAGYTLMQDLIDSGDALFVSNPEALVEIMSQCGWKPVPDTVSNKYYRQGFIENLLPLII